MRKILALLFVLFSLPTMAQISQPEVIYVTSAPSGACAAAPPIQVVNSTGTAYTCNNGTWAAVAGGGGGGAPGGASGTVQYNNAGAFGGLALSAGIFPAGNATTGLGGTQVDEGVTSALTVTVGAADTGGIAASVHSGTDVTHYQYVENLYTAVAPVRAIAAHAVRLSAKSDPGAGGLEIDMVNPAFTSVSGAQYLTNTRCASAASPAVCAAAPAGFVNVLAAGTTIVVNTTAVTANSTILVQEDTTLGTALSVTCNTTTATAPPKISARTAGTSFTITTTTPTTNPRCFSYTIVN